MKTTALATFPFLMENAVSVPEAIVVYNAWYIFILTPFFLLKLSVVTEGNWSGTEY